jgi:hypothetical protein
LSDKEAAMATTRAERGKKLPTGGAAKVRAAPAAVAGGGAKRFPAGPPAPGARAASGKAPSEKLARRHPDVARALAELASANRIAGVRSEKISARVDPGVLGAAAERLGLDKRDVSEVVNASLAIAAAPDRFKAWLRNTGDSLPDDFKLAV